MNDNNNPKPRQSGKDINDKTSQDQSATTTFTCDNPTVASSSISIQLQHAEAHVCSTEEEPKKPNASWMSGNYGIGFRIPAGGIAPPVIDNQFIPQFQVKALVQQVVALNVSWVIVNLSAGAFGDRYLSYHPLLSTLNPGSTPLAQQDGGRSDLWGEIASALHAHGIACIAYIATQGPAMLKHGPTKAYDYDESTGTAPSIQRWHDYVHEHYGSDDVETLHVAFCDVIIQYYAKHYGNLIDGWWFDHAHFGNISLLHAMVKKYNPYTVIAFNRGRKVPLYNNNPGYEDYTSGHPTPLRQHLPNSSINEAMVTSIEATPDGFFRGPSPQELSLGHVYMPMGPTWNGMGSENCWCHCQAVDWMGRVMRAKGAWTWNLARQGNNPFDPSSSLLDFEKVEFLQKVIQDLKRGGGDDEGKTCCSCSSNGANSIAQQLALDTTPCGETTGKQSCNDILEEPNPCTTAVSGDILTSASSTAMN